uniref:LacI family DNA-binding transcriptional regulator n=1 Tax=uncultured Draconibacterium sp. TaxID=1573823 RepID=UPI0032174BE1
MKRVSIKDIAKQLGVSTTLVSFVLNGKAKENRVSEEMAAKVLKLAEELNYKPNYFAKNLRKGKTNVIGLIVGDISNPFFAKIARFVEDEVAKEGYQLIVGSSDENAEKTNKIIRLFVQKNIDGLIIAPGPNSSESIVWLKKQNIPFVLIDRYFKRIKTNYVGVENSTGVRLAVKYFVEKEYDKIALIAYENGTSNIKERIEGFKITLRENGLKLYRNFIQFVSYDDPASQMKDVIQFLLNNENVPRAIIFATNSLGLLGVQELIANRVRIPQDISVVSFDDDSAFRMSYPPITVVEQPLQEMASEAVSILMESMEQQDNYVIQHVVKPVHLIARKS